MMTVLGRVGWRGLPERRGRWRAYLLALVLLLFVVFLVYQGTQNEAAPADVYNLETPEGFITFRVLDSGELNICQPGALCFVLGLENSVARIVSVRVDGASLHFDYIDGQAVRHSSRFSLTELYHQLSFGK